MTDQVKEDETLEELQIRSASWYRQKLKYTQIIYETNEETHVANITLNILDDIVLNVFDYFLLNIVGRSLVA